MWPRTHVHTGTDVAMSMNEERETTQEAASRAEGVTKWFHVSNTYMYGCTVLMCVYVNFQLYMQKVTRGRCQSSIQTYIYKCMYIHPL